MILRSKGDSNSSGGGGLATVEEVRHGNTVGGKGAAGGGALGCPRGVSSPPPPNPHRPWVPLPPLVVLHTPGADGRPGHARTRTHARTHH